MDENRKAEFILGEIIYHSPIYGGHWTCSIHLLRWLLPCVYIDPDLETIEQYLLRGTEYQLIQKIREGSLESEDITGFKISMNDIFAEAD